MGAEKIIATEIAATNNCTSVEIQFHELNRFRSILSEVLEDPLRPVKNFR